MTDTLRERVARALWEAQCEHWQPYRAKLEAAGKLCDYLMLSDGRQRELMSEADAAIALVLEEAAKVAEMLGGSVRKGNIIEALYVPPTAKDIAAAIRAMKENDDA